MNDEPRHFVEQLGRRGLPTRRLEEQFQVLDRLVQILQNFLAATYGGCGGANSMAGLLVHCLAIHINDILPNSKKMLKQFQNFA